MDWIPLVSIAFSFQSHAVQLCFHAQSGIYFQLGDVKGDVEGLVVRKLDQSPEYLGRLLKGFFGTHDFGEESYRNFSRLCDPDLIVQLAQRYGDSALTDEQSRSVMK